MNDKRGSEGYFRPAGWPANLKLAQICTAMCTAGEQQFRSKECRRRLEYRVEGAQPCPRARVVYLGGVVGG